MITFNKHITIWNRIGVFFRFYLPTTNLFGFKAININLLFIVQNIISFRIHIHDDKFVYLIDSLTGVYRFFSFLYSFLKLISCNDAKMKDWHRQLFIRRSLMIGDSVYNDDDGKLKDNNIDSRHGDIHQTQMLTHIYSSLSMTRQWLATTA